MTLACVTVVCDGDLPAIDTLTLKALIININHGDQRDFFQFKIILNVLELA